MGMFDSFYNDRREEWQTKALRNLLDVYDIGDTVAVGIKDCQIEVLGEINKKYINSHATIRDRVLVKVPDERDETLTLIEYHGFVWERDTDERKEES